MRRVMPWMIAFTLAAPAVSAQMPVGENLRELDDDAPATYRGLTVRQLDDMRILHNGQKIGEVEEILADTQGEIVAVAVEIEDGFFDLDDKEVIMPLAILEISADGSQGTVSLSEDEIRALPVWDD